MKIEDFPVLNTAKALQKQGFDVTFLDVDAEGFADLEGLKKAITKETVLVSIQHGNQEIGTVQDLKAISEICEEKDVLLHTDATHSFTRLPLSVKELPVDLITMSAHTIHGPRGIGALYIRKDTPINKFMDGGFQEFNLRAGVENIPGAVGFAKAVELVTEEENRRLKAMRDRVIEKVSFRDFGCYPQRKPGKTPASERKPDFPLCRRRICNSAYGHEGFCSKHGFSLF